MDDANNLRHKKAWREIAKIEDHNIRNALFMSNDESFLEAVKGIYPQCFEGSSQTSPRLKLLDDFEAEKQNPGGWNYENVLDPLDIPIVLSWHEDGEQGPMPRKLRDELLEQWNPYSSNPLSGSIVFYQGMACMVISWDGFPYANVESTADKLTFWRAKDEFQPVLVDLIPAVCVDFSR